MADRILICGGCGFIGANFALSVAQAQPTAQITILDSLTYAGSLANLGQLIDSPRLKFVQGDIGDSELVDRTLSRGFDVVVNFAAETHVDRSLFDTAVFVRSNVWGVEVLLSSCRKYSIPFLQISTDEVYGPTPEGEAFDESAPMNPSSPYAASKAAADLLVLAAMRSLGQQAAIVRATNNFGPRQFPEKLIPFFLHRINSGQPLPLYGDGLQRRCWLYVEDFCAALLRLIADFPGGEVINIGADSDPTNLEVVTLLRELTGSTAAMTHVSDRPAHDRRYRIDSAKYVARYGAIVQRDLRDGLAATIDWYRKNSWSFDRLRGEQTAEFLRRHYDQRGA